MTKQPHIGVYSEQISERVIVCGEPDRVNRIAALLEQPELLGNNREYRVMQGRFQQQTITVCSTGIGAPSAIIALEELVQSGAQYMVRVGSAGALQPEIRLGDLIVAEAAVRDEGGSKAYVEPSFPAFADHQLIAGITSYLNQSDAKAHYGVVRSHDSFYTDKEDQICQYWHQKGVLGADMETSALLTVGKLRGLKVAAILNNVVLYQQDVQDGVNQYSDSETITVQGEMQAARAALHALCVQH